MIRKVALFVLFAGLLNAQVLTPNTGVANDQGARRDVNVAYQPRTTQTSYGYNDGYIGLGVTFLPWAFPNSDYDVVGLRLNLGWGAYRKTTGLDVGTFSVSTDAQGLQINLFGNAAKNDAAGMQIGLVNVDQKSFRGLQIGLVNYTDELKGVQIGLLNFVHGSCSVPILSIGW